MPHARMGKLLQFKDPMIKLEDIQPIVEAFQKNNSFSTLRTSFQKLLTTFSANATLSHPICEWINKNMKLSKVQLQPEVDTLFSICVLLGDMTTVQIAMATGAHVNHYRGNLNIKPQIQRCLRHNDWQRQLARGLDVQIQDCISDRQIGCGSFGTVYKSSFRGEPCAMKQFRAPFPLLPVEGILDNVLSEIQLMLQCQHQNVVQCYGFFLWDIQFPKTKPCLFLELMATTVHDLLDPRCKSVEDAIQQAFSLIKTRLQIMCDAAAGLKYLHERTPPIIHRDVKPANILLRMEKGQLCAKLSDFGLSSSNKNYATRTATQGGVVAMGTRAAGGGTPAFMSLEQWDAKKIQSTKADIFSFALTLFAVMCKVTEPWFDMTNYEQLVCGSSEFYELTKIQARVKAGKWPKWPTCIPDAECMVTVPLICRQITKATLKCEPQDRLSMYVVSKCLETHMPPETFSKFTDDKPPTWVSSSDLTKAIPNYFDAVDFVLPPFLRDLPHIALPATIEDALWMLTQSGMHIAILITALEQCRKKLEEKRKLWEKDNDIFEETASLDDDVLLAIMLYTWGPDGSEQMLQAQGFESSVIQDCIPYRRLNQALRSEKYEDICPFLPYLKLLLTSMSTFARADVKRRVKQAPLLHRGIRKSRKVYKQDESVTTWDFMSTSSEGRVGRLYGQGEKAAYIQIHNGCGIDVTDLSYFGSAEREVLLVPGTCLQVLDMYQRQNIKHIVMQHVRPVSIDGDDDSKSINSNSSTVTFPKMLDQVPNVDILSTLSARIHWDSLDNVPTDCKIELVVSAFDGSFNTLFPLSNVNKTELFVGAYNSADTLGEGGAGKEAHVMWEASTSMPLWPGMVFKIQLHFEFQNDGKLFNIHSYPATVEMPPSIPPLIMIKDAVIVEKWENIQNWQEHCIELHFKMPQHFGGSDVLEWRVAAYVKDGFTDEWKHCGSSADVALHADQVNALLKVTPLPKWLGQECTFQILMRNEYGWNASASNFRQVVSNTRILTVPRNSDVVRLSEKDSERLQKGLVGNMFGANPESVMVQLALTPQSRPFAFTTKTILQYAVDTQLRSAQHLVDMPEQGNMNVYFVLILAYRHYVCKTKYEC